MKIPVILRALFLPLLAATTINAYAQGTTATQVRPSDDGAGLVRPVDYIVAIVNSEPITNSEIEAEFQNALRQGRINAISEAERKRIRDDVLEGLIQRRVQLQLAKENGLRIDTTAIDQAEASVAQRNQLSLQELHARLAQEGIAIAKFRDQLREQLTLDRLREREVEPRVRVSELDIDQYILAQQTPEAAAKQLLNIGQILIAVPESASADELRRLQDRAQEAIKRARAGDKFADLVRAYGEPSTHANGAAMGLRPPERYPALFVDAVLSLQPGEIAGPVRSPAGFHVLKLVERVNPDLPASKVVQSLSRHILLRPGPQLNEAQALERLRDFKRRIAQGSATFSGLAREFSQDGSASQGGDLGWASPGMFVPEFEDVMNQLAPGEISEPFASRFGLHLLQLLERREQAVSEDQIRQSIRNRLRQQKLEEAYKLWVKELRERAYVDLREAPQ